jgi:hypothetical protein
VNHRATFLAYNLYISIGVMVIVDIRAQNLEYLTKILNLSRSRSLHFYRLGLRLHLKFRPTPTPEAWFQVSDLCNTLEGQNLFLSLRLFIDAPKA